MTIKRCISFAAAFSIVLVFLACTTPQDVLNDYNKHFEKTPAATQNILENGNASSMLQELYKVDIEHTLVLTAPVGCESYAWKITDVGRDTPYVLPHTSQSDIRLTVYIPKTPLYEAVLKADGKSRLYDVTLTVKYKDKVYSDTAVLVLYAPD